MICKRGHTQTALTRCGDKCRVCQQLLQAKIRNARRLAELLVWLVSARMRVKAIRKQVQNANFARKRRNSK